MKKIVIAIDGFSSCGKSTMAKDLAREVGYIYIDSGAMYRAVTCDKLFARRDSGCKCPKCGTGSMQFYGKVVRCDNAECGLPVFRLKANRTLTDDEIKDLLTDGHTKLLKGFKSKQGKSFDAVVAFDGDYNTTFVFPERKSKATSARRRK